jgi:D-tagatose-1,6-bisphosphate aldolase subunit GatZ/KbaZ
MRPLNTLIHTLIDLRERRQTPITLLAVCPNSAAVLEAAVRAASLSGAPMLFAATLNQVDVDGGYTGWTPAEFVSRLNALAQKYAWAGPLYPCLDHGGPWLKDRHTLDRLTLDETMARVKVSLAACVEAGYQLLHIDPTVDRTLPPGTPVPPETVAARTVELMAHAEQVRVSRGLPPIAYEVGTEEVHGGLVDDARFAYFLQVLRHELEAHRLLSAWPCFMVAQVGTDLHTTCFDPAAAGRLYATLAPLGSLAKGHYTDWVDNPQDYPLTGMGGANVGPEFTAAEFLALQELERKEAALCRLRPGLAPARFRQTLEEAVIASGRWQKWLQPAERGLDFSGLTPDRRDWLLQTGARYVWAQPAVVAARQELYAHLAPVLPDPDGYVVDRIALAIDRYLNRFNLFGSLEALG